MKKFRIHVNGKAYEVEVEEIGGIEVPEHKVQAPVKAPAQPMPSQTPASAPVFKAVPQGAEVVTSPMPGKIMNIKVAVGQSVQEGDLLLTLEAMKMENEIFSSASGTVKEIRVSEGSAVNPGDVLVVIG